MSDLLRGVIMLGVGVPLAALCGLGILWNPIARALRALARPMSYLGPRSWARSLDVTDDEMTEWLVTAERVFLALVSVVLTIGGSYVLLVKAM